MEQKIKHLIREINFTYYGIYLVTVLVAIGIFLLNIGNVNFYQIEETSSLGRNISTIYLIYLLISIPFSLYGFTKRAKKWQTIENRELMLIKYKNGARLRIIVIGLALIMGLVLVYLMKSKSMIFSSAIAAVGLYFSKPTFQKIRKDLNLME